jgi:hypothetical protein
MAREGVGEMSSLSIDLEEPCTCCCVADYGGRTQAKFCATAEMGFGCLVQQGCATAEHHERSGKSRRHLSAHCHSCYGHGAIPNDFGREVLEFVARHANERA